MWRAGAALSIARLNFQRVATTYFGQQNELASCESRTKPQTSLRMRLALYQPDIPQNTGTILRLCGCLGIEVHIIEPVGFPSTDRAFRRAGMDYLEAVTITRHASWQDFEAWRRAAGLPPYSIHHQSGQVLSRLQLCTGRCTAVWPGIGRRSRNGPCCGRRPALNSDAARHAFAQCRDRRRDRRRRSAQTNRRYSRAEPKPQ